MAHKQLSYRSEAREKVLRGANALVDAVRVRIALENAVSVASVLLLTEVPEPKHDTMPSPGGLD